MQNYVSEAIFVVSGRQIQRMGNLCIYLYRNEILFIIECLTINKICILSCILSVTAVCLSVHMKNIIYLSIFLYILIPEGDIRRVPGNQVLGVSFCEMLAL